MQVYLYMCENCGVASFKEVDRGDLYYECACVGCSAISGGSFFHKVSIKKNLFGSRICEPLKGFIYYRSSLQETYLFECEGLNDTGGENSNEHTSNVDRS